MQKRYYWMTLFVALLAFGWSVQKPAGKTVVRSAEERANLVSDPNLKRVDTLLLSAKRKAAIDCWIIMSREFNKDVVLQYIEDNWGSTRGHRNACIFLDNGSDRVQRIVIGMHLPEESKVWDKSLSCLSGEGDVEPSLKPILRKTIAEFDPEKIGINTSRTNPFSDGLNAALKDFLVESIGPDWFPRNR